jgi:lysylphosphatidylglycerol synthetase-like protein (DUF2156 family)
LAKKKRTVWFACVLLLICAIVLVLLPIPVPRPLRIAVASIDVIIAAVLWLAARQHFGPKGKWCGVE